MGASTAPGVRRAEVVGVLSLAADLGMGQPLEQGLRGCLVAQRLARLLGLDDAEVGRSAALALLRFVGCTADSHTAAVFFDDEIAARAVTTSLIYGSAGESMGAMVRLVGGDSLRGKASTSVALAATGWQRFRAGAAAHCEVARMLAERLDFDDATRRGLDHAFERWDGKGFPHRLRGEQIERTARIVHVAYDVAACAAGGRDSMLAMARERSGRGYDPGVVDALCADPRACVDVLEIPDAWAAVMATAPGWGGGSVLRGDTLDAALAAVADFADLKSLFTPGHSRAVASSAGEAAAELGLTFDEVAMVRRAALVHDLGRVAVSVHVWDKPGPLSRDERERARLHAYYTERILAPIETWAGLGRLASLHHERLDGSGYHRGIPATGLPTAARILAAADVHQAMTEPRPHRPALRSDEAAAALRAEAAAGRLDREAVDAVLGGGRRGRREPAARPGLSPREVEVLRLLARGGTTRQIARALDIAVKTADSHIQHIYTKAGVSTRAAATLFAVEQGLLPAP